MAIGLVAIMAVDLIDAFWIAYLGDNALTAIGFVMPITSFFMAIGIGISSGASVKLAQLLGSHNPSFHCKCFVFHILILSAMLTFFCVIIGILSINPLFTFLGAKGEILSLISQYMFIWYLGMTMLVIPMVGNGLIRATGAPTWPTVIMVTAAIGNAILDPIFIFGFGPIPPLGIQGAALATLIVRALAMFAMIAILHFQLKIIHWHIPSPSELLKSLLAILPVSSSSTFSFIVNPIANSFIISLIASIGAVEVAGFNIGIRIEMVALVLIIGISSSIGPIIAQNYGAQLIPRVISIRKNGFLLILATALLFALATSITAPFIAPLFGDNPDIQNITIIYLSFIPLSWLGLGISMCASHVLNATGRPVLSAFTTLSRAFILYVPLAYLLKEPFGFHGIIAALAIANLSAGTLSWFLSSIKEKTQKA
jgi:putative MATE family efflux protein